MFIALTSPDGTPIRRNIDTMEGYEDECIYFDGHKWLPVRETAAEIDALIAAAMPVVRRKATPVSCPICGGQGKVSSSFYAVDPKTAHPNHRATCKACGGMGIMWAGEQPGPLKD